MQDNFTSFEDALKPLVRPSRVAGLAAVESEFAPRRVAESAISDSVHDASHAMRGFTFDEMMQLAERLARVAPEPHAIAMELNAWSKEFR